MPAAEAATVGSSSNHVRFFSDVSQLPDTVVKQEPFGHLRWLKEIQDCFGCTGLPMKQARLQNTDSETGDRHTHTHTHRTHTHTHTHTHTPSTARVMRCVSVHTAGGSVCRAPSFPDATRSVREKLWATMERERGSEQAHGRNREGPRAHMQ